MRIEQNVEACKFYKYQKKYWKYGRILAIGRSNSQYHILEEK